MRRCSGCGELTDYFEAECASCHYFDSAWNQVLLSSAGRDAPEPDGETDIAPRQEAATSRASKAAPQHPVIPISSFSDSAELAFELDKLGKLIKSGRIPDDPEIRFDFTQIGLDWESAGGWEVHEFIPGTVGVLALTEACRATYVARRMFPGAKLVAVLPPKEHPASALLLEGAVLSAIQTADIVFSQSNRTAAPDSVRALDLETIVPFTPVDEASSGQLSDTFHKRFSALASAGAISKNYGPPYTA